MASSSRSNIERCRRGNSNNFSSILNDIKSFLLFVNRSLRSTNHQTAKETQFHHHKSTTNLIDHEHDDLYVEDIAPEMLPGDGDDDDDDEPAVHQHHQIHGRQHNHLQAEANKSKKAHNTQPQIDDDSMRRHEIDRGSDIGAVIHKRSHQTNEHDPNESPPAERRDQLYLKEGNAEILRLVTRGKHDDDQNNIYVNVPGTQAVTAPQPQFFMVDNGGKEILMRRFIEEQANGKHIIREHYQIIPGHQTAHAVQHMPNEVHPMHQLHIPPPPPLETYANSQAGSAIYAKINEPHGEQQQAHQHQQQQQQPHGSNQSLVHMELETSLKQQNALLRQILLEKEKLQEKYDQHEVAMETQSLPGHSLAMATQTDCEAATQTDAPPTNADRRRRRARSENDDSMSEQDDYEMVRYTPPDNSPPGVYWVRRKRRQSRPKGSVVQKPVRRRVVLVDDIKRKIRTPIKEESEELAISPAIARRQRQVVHETRTSAMRQQRSESSTPVRKTAAKRTTSGLKREVLLEISDSLDDAERSSPEQRTISRTGRNSRLVRHVEYYEEESDESDGDIVIRRNTYSADSLDDYSGSEELDESHRARGGSRVVHSRQGSVTDLKEAQTSYRKKDEYERRRFESHTASGIPRLSRKDSSSIDRDKSKMRGQTASQPPAESRAGRRTASVHRQKAHSEADLLHPDDESPPSNKGVPKYMEWYYSKNQRSENTRPEKEHPSRTAANKKPIGAIEKRIKAKAPRSRSDDTKFKPEPLPRNNGNSQPSEASRLLREDVQMNKTHAAKIQTDTNHPLLQYSEHRYEREYNPAPDLPPAPIQVSHYMYPETPPIAAKPAKPIRLSVQGQRPKPSPIHEHQVKDFKVVIPIEAHHSTAAHHHHHQQQHSTKQLNAATLEDDHDSGIAMNSLLHSMARRHPITDKKSVFTIAYDDVKVKRIQSESDSQLT